MQGGFTERSVESVNLVAGRGGKYRMADDREKYQDSGLHRDIVLPGGGVKGGLRYTEIFMLWSKLFIPTLRENPVETGTVSHRLLIRAGYIRRLSADRLGYLPLGHRALRRIERVAREEMEMTGAQEICVSHDDDAAILARELRSYRQLPQIWYQLRCGGMQFWTLGVNACFERHWRVLERIFMRCQLPFVSIGTGDSREFVVESTAGESSVAQCPGCHYSAMRDRAAATPSAPLLADPDGDRTPEAFHTPGRKTIAEISAFTGLPDTAQMKSLVMVAASRPVLVLVRGDHQLSETKLSLALGVLSVRVAQPDEIRAWFGAGAGSLGPVGVTNMRVLADAALRGRRNMIAGANRDDYHLRDVTPGADFQPEYFDLRRVEDGDTCQDCGATLAFRKVIEIAHFRTLASADPHVTSEASEEVPVRMGSAHIDFESMLRAAVTLWNDQDGIVLPAAMAPFEVVITPVNVQDAGQRETAESLHSECASIGLDALYDDRHERPGVKFKDADLIGVPWRITVGKKLALGLVEVLDRTRISYNISVGEAARFVKSAVQ